MSEKLTTTEWTPRPCPICGATGDELKPLELRVRNCDVDDGFCVFEHHDVCCQVCGFVFASKIPTDEFLIDFQKRTTLRFDKTYDPEARLSLIRQLVPKGGKVLEVGGARHEFTALLKAEDYKVAVKEIADPWPDDEYDAIVSYFVLEHVPDPRGFLRECYKRVKVGGHIVIEVPHYGTHTLFSMFREHLNHFIRRHLISLMVTVGFDCPVEQNGKPSREYGFVITGIKFGNPSEINEKLYRQCMEEYGTGK